MQVDGVGGVSGNWPSGGSPDLTPRGAATMQENWAIEKINFILKKFEKSPLSPEDKTQILRAVGELKGSMDTLKGMIDRDPDRKIFSADEAEFIEDAKRWSDNITDVTPLSAIEDFVGQMRVYMECAKESRPK
jgi:hypothetical protein